jgi:aspartate-semialdehyde dehydrogenase
MSVIRERVRMETKACLLQKANLPAIQVVHAPVFYGTAFTAWAELEGGGDVEKISKGCQNAGFAMTMEGEAGPNNVTAAGERMVQLATPEAAGSPPGSWWFWGAADNIRLPAANAVKLAEMLA